jgi:hypothetical protein
MRTLTEYRESHWRVRDNNGWIVARGSKAAMLRCLRSMIRDARGCDLQRFVGGDRSNDLDWVCEPFDAGDDILIGRDGEMHRLK